MDINKSLEQIKQAGFHEELGKIKDERRYANEARDEEIGELLQSRDYDEHAKKYPGQTFGTNAALLAGTAAGATAGVVLGRKLGNHPIIGGVLGGVTGLLGIGGGTHQLIRKKYPAYSKGLDAIMDRDYTEQIKQAAYKDELEKIAARKII